MLWMMLIDVPENRVKLFFILIEGANIVPSPIKRNLKNMAIFVACPGRETNGTSPNGILLGKAETRMA